VAGRGVIPRSLFSRALEGIVPYEPGKPVEEVQRELGLDRVVKLASNEGPYGPFPVARDAIAHTTGELNRYPDGGAYRLRAALAERHGVAFEEVITGAGADGLIDCLSQVFLDRGDEIVCGWPSFVSYVIDARKLGATPHLVPLKRPRRDACGDRPAHEARLHLPAQQPDRHDEYARRAGRVVRARARTRRHRRRPGVLRVPR
jgi:histidinol-phosphate/aromatic aminotransferase/cobyric acid decarboxylase-like protein